jgi:glycosyltransferase involved in cell wall biosynthesis
VVRVLIIAYTNYMFDARVKRHAEALAERGYEVDVICLAGQDTSRPNVRIVGIPLPRYRGHSRTRYVQNYFRFFTRATWVALKLHLKWHYDLVIVCSIPDAAIVSGLLPRLFGSKLVLDIHDTMPELYREKFPGKLGSIGEAALRMEERMSAWFSNMVFAVHDLHLERLQTAGIPRDKIIVVLNAPDPRLFRPSIDSGKPGSNGFTVVTHGTINRRLGLETAVRAVSLLRDSIPQLKFRIIGPGEYKESVQALAQGLDLGQIVHFEDGVPLERLAETLRGASLGLVPNLATAATQLMLPVKMLEYVYLGIPVVAASLRTIRHYFPDDAIRYFQPENPQSLADNLMDLYCHPEHRQVLARRAYEVIKRISWESQRRILYQAVDSLLPKSQAENSPKQSSVSRQA